MNYRKKLSLAEAMEIFVEDRKITVRSTICEW